MKPVTQSVIDGNEGDCLSACVASILEVPLEDVPNFAKLDFEARQRGEETPGLGNQLKAWLNGYHRSLIRIDTVGPNDTLSHLSVGCGEYVILCGNSPRVDANGISREHAVVGVTNGWGFKIVHDPFPSGGDLSGPPTSAWWIVHKLPPDHYMIRLK